MSNFRDIKIGDTVKRMLAGSIPMKLRVIEITEDRIITGGGWEFSRNNGAEIDEDLGWDERHTGSVLTLAMEH
jgi:hypothetical protein